MSRSAGHRSIARRQRRRSAARLAIDGHGRYDVRTGIRFFDHMLELFTRHGGFDLTLQAKGDLDVDQHHTVEDVGIVLGEAVLEGARRPQGHQSRRLLRDADGRDARGRGASISSGRPHAVVDLKVKVRHGRRSAERAGARLLRGLRPGRARQRPRRRCSTADRATTTSRRCSRRLRGRCASPARRDARLAKMLPSTKGLSVIALIDYGAGNLTSVRKALASLGADFATPAIAGRCARAAGADRARRRPLRRHRRARRRSGARRSPLRVSAGTPLLGICLGHAVAVRGQRRSAGGARARPDARTHARGCAATRPRLRFRTSAGMRCELPRPVAAASTASHAARRCTSRTRTPRRSPTTASPRRRTPTRSRRLSSATTSSACSSTRRNRATPGLQILRNFLEPCDARMLTKRIIACLDVRDGQVVKGVQFQQLRARRRSRRARAPLQRGRDRRGRDSRHHRHAREAPGAGATRSTPWRARSSAAHGRRRHPHPRTTPLRRSMLAPTRSA